MNTTLEEAVPILEKWLRENIDGALRSDKILFHLSPKEVQEELGLTPSTFWYALYRLQENGSLVCNQPMYLTIYNTKRGQT